MIFCNKVIWVQITYIIKKKVLKNIVKELRMWDMEKEKILLNVEETAAYLNIGKTKVRELMKENQKVFVIRIGNRNYAHKELLDKWLLAQVKN